MICDLEFVKKLLDNNPEIDISSDNERPFCWACLHGYLEIAKLLLEKKPDIYIHSDNDYAFRCACAQNHLEIAKWLQSLYPERYYIEVVDDKVVSFEINK